MQKIEKERPRKTPRPSTNGTAHGIYETRYPLDQGGALGVVGEHEVKRGVISLFLMTHYGWTPDHKNFWL